MSGLFGGGKSTSTTEDRLVGISLQTSAYGGAVPIAYGTDRLTGNMIWYNDFTAIPHTTTQQVGKGGGGSTVSNTTYTYTASTMLALGEGVITAINRVWRDKDLGALSAWWPSFFTGARPQTAWSFLTSNHPAEAIGYMGTAYVAASATDLGSSATMKNFSFECTALFAIASPNPGNPDAHPADIIPDFLTNAFYGAGWTSARIGDLTTGAGSYRNYCTAAGLFISPTFAEQKAAADHLGEILEATNSAPVWSDGGAGSMVLKIIPYGDTALSGNGAVYTPNTTPLYDLTVDDFLVSSPDEDPIQVERVSPADAFNSVPVEFRDRLLDYNTSVVDDPDPVDVEVFGLRKAPVLTLHCIKKASVALQVSRIKAQRYVYCRNKYRFKLGWKYCLLEGMDLVTLTEAKLGLNKKVVRIREVEESEDGQLDILAEEWPFGVASATLFTTATGDGTVPNMNADPGNANAPVTLEAPLLLQSGNQPELWLGTSGTPSLWGGCDIYVSTDGGTSYGKVGSILQPARHGVTTATLASGSDPDTTNTLSVDLTASKGTLASTDLTGRDAMVTLALVENELVSYQTATLTGTNTYNLTSLRRGAYGTAVGSHASGVKFMRLDEGVFRLPYDPSLKGKTIYIKLRSFNVWGGGLQDLASVTAYSVVLGATMGGALPVATSVTIATSTTKPS